MLSSLCLRRPCLRPHKWLSFSSSSLNTSSSSHISSDNTTQSSLTVSEPDQQSEQQQQQPQSTDNDLYRFSKVVPYDRAMPKEYLTRLNTYLKDNRFNRKKQTRETHPHLHYLASRLPLEYAVIDRVLRETHKLLPGWVPESVFDIGAKVNNVLWSVRAIWGAENIKSYTCVEDNQEMVNSSKELSSDLGISFARQLQLTSDPDAKRRKGVRPPFVSADLAVCAYHLEGVGVKKRKSYLREMWKRTDNILVLIEPSFDLISEAREFLLREYPDCTVLAPCGHDKPCPMLRRTLLSGVKHDCFFQHRFLRGYLPARSPLRDVPKEIIHERFSYVVFRRKGSFNITLPPNTDMTEAPSIFTRPKKVRVEEPPKTPEELEDERRLAELEEEEYAKLASLSKEQVAEMFAIPKPNRDPMLMPRIPEEDKEDEEEDEFTKGWYTEEEEELPRELPPGVISKATLKQQHPQGQQLSSVSEEEELSENDDQDGEDGDVGEDEDFLVLRDGENTTEDKKEEISYIPRKSWYSQKWSRVLSPPDKRVRHLVLDLCTPEGILDQQILGKSQPTYRLARQLRWGDIWGFPKPPSKKETRTIRTWNFKNQQRKQWKAEGKWEAIKAEMERKRKVREKKLMEQGLLDEEQQSKITHQKPPKSARKKIA